MSMLVVPGKDAMSGKQSRRAERSSTDRPPASRAAHRGTRALLIPDAWAAPAVPSAEPFRELIAPGIHETADGPASATQLLGRGTTRKAPSSRRCTLYSSPPHAGTSPPRTACDALGSSVPTSRRRSASPTPTTQVSRTQGLRSSGEFPKQKDADFPSGGRAIGRGGISVWALPFDAEQCPGHIYRVVALFVIFPSPVVFLLNVPLRLLAQPGPRDFVTLSMRRRVSPTATPETPSPSFLHWSTRFAPTVDNPLAALRERQHAGFTATPETPSPSFSHWTSHVASRASITCELEVQSPNVRATEYFFAPAESGNVSTSGEQDDEGRSMKRRPTNSGSNVWASGEQGRPTREAMDRRPASKVDGNATLTSDRLTWEATYGRPASKVEQLVRQWIDVRRAGSRRRDQLGKQHIAVEDVSTSGEQDECESGCQDEWGGDDLMRKKRIGHHLANS
ncbi:hypothetical protein BD626DRAFT_535019 [Schizophyllum amplum]|uniref:Uncharacterized protein n=1 Tax=Schizophyllum amplum TaxID=97359 RepID=A0A550CQB2_9AGAR|nr:hypothetical protein BD626DRAFT_535019 [Auriculariopsis ampla]